MCTKVLVCHGDRAIVPIAASAYSEEQKRQCSQPGGQTDCSPATYYLTNDGKHLVDADFAAGLEHGGLSGVPKIPIQTPVDVKSIYTEEHRRQHKKDNKPASFYVTRDGKYAIDADHVSLDDLDRLDLTAVPKIQLG